MLRGYRGVIVAAYGWLALGAADPPKQAEQAKQAESSQQLSQAANTIAAAISDAAEPLKEDRGCDYGNDQRRSDLCAQWKAADAASNAAKYAFWTLLIGAAGTGLLVWTLWETRATSRRQLRAYVLPTMITHEEFEIGKSGAVNIHWQNCGQTPAYKVLTMLKVEFYSMNVEEKHLEPEFPDDLSEGPIAPGCTIGGRVQTVRIINERHWAAYLSGDAQFVAFGKMTYQDIFGRTYETKFRFRARHVEPMPFGFVTAPRGNSAT